MLSPSQLKQIHPCSTYMENTTYMIKFLSSTCTHKEELPSKILTEEFSKPLFYLTPQKQLKEKRGQNIRDPLSNTSNQKNLHILLNTVVPKWVCLSGGGPPDSSCILNNCFEQSSVLSWYKHWRVLQVIELQKIHWKYYHYSTHLHFIAITYPDVSILVVRFPVSPCITVEHPILSDPVRAAVPALGCNSTDLLPIPKIHLQPLVMITVWWRPTSCTCCEEAEGRFRSQAVALMGTRCEDADCWKSAQLRGIEYQNNLNTYKRNMSSH